MVRPRSAAPLAVLVLLTGATASAQSPPEDVPHQQVAHIELKAEPSSPLREIRVSRGRATCLAFDSAIDPGSSQLKGLGGLSGQESFVELAPAPKTLCITPSEQLILPEGQAALPEKKDKFWLSVRFAEEGAPASATFTLRVVSPWEGVDSHVEIIRQQRTLASIERLSAAQTSPGGLTGLLTNKLLDKQGVQVRDITPEVTVREEALSKRRVLSVSSSKRVALELTLRNAGEEPWSVNGTHPSLTTKGGKKLKILLVWQPTPIAPGEVGTVVVEAEATPEQAEGVFTLELPSTVGEGLTLKGIRFHRVEPTRR
jgi:uncharacterized protein (TIGR02268 family)